MTPAQVKRWRAYSLRIAVSKNLAGDDAENAAQAGVVAAWRASKTKLDKEYLSGACLNGVNEWIRNDIAQRKGRVFIEETPDEAFARNDDVSSIELSMCLGNLTPREWLVAKGLMENKPYREMAAELGVSHQAVSGIVEKLRKKLSWLVDK